MFPMPWFPYTEVPGAGVAYTDFPGAAVPDVVVPYTEFPGADIPDGGVPEAVVRPSVENHDGTALKTPLRFSHPVISALNLV